MVMKEGTKTITFIVDSETKFEIEMAAHEENRSVNNWITNIIKNYLKEQKCKKQGLEITLQSLKLYSFNQSWFS